MTTLNAKNLTLDQVHRFLNLQERFESLPFSKLLLLEPLTEFEQQELIQIRDDFRYYLTSGKVLEGQIKLLVLAPLLRLAGFYRFPIQITLEQDIAEIAIADEDITINGRADILAINKLTAKAVSPYFWVLVIETKNSQIDALAGLPQLLTYAAHSLEGQTFVWGLTTNGVSYRFVYLQAGQPVTYQLLPEVNLIDAERAVQLLQALKAIRNL
ncbi:MAG: restriction endonuclease subunit R [Leptolyngbyaceae cyanobacterium RU_5_1]|nr:restriction endonuclease subunit R [Leptolyngbyaceae cyanobacterium RU_5_1]